MDNIESKPKIRPYRDSEALRRAQKKSYENNKEEKLRQRKIYYKTWLESQNIDEMKAKRRQAAKLRYERSHALKILAKQDKPPLVENPLLNNSEYNINP